jgi:hypothetical protein
MPGVDEFTLPDMAPGRVRLTDDQLAGTGTAVSR